MRFLVCVKQVVDTSKMEVDPNTGRLNRNNANSIINPLDLHALEAALALRDQVGGTVTVLTMGPPQAEQVLHYAVSMGADDVYLATDRAFGGADTLATSYTLAAAIRKLGSFDLIFCGQESLDSNTAQIGPEVAAMLSMPDVSGAVDISYEREGYITVRRQLSDEDEVLEMKLPALITTAESLNRPRYPSVLGIMKKDHVEIHKLTSADLDVDPSRIGLTGSPTRVKQVRPVVPPKKENLRIEGKTTDEAVDLLCTAMQKIHVI